MEERHGPMPSDADARALARYWHDDADLESPLTALAQTGEISEATVRLLERDLERLCAATGDLQSAAPVVAQAQLTALLTYARGHAERGPVAGWTALAEQGTAALTALFQEWGVALQEEWGVLANTDGDAAPPPRGVHETGEGSPHGPPRAELYEQIGGGRRIADVVETFYRTILADAALAPYFEGMDVKAIKAHQFAFMSAATGGPEYYVGRPIDEAHADLGIPHEDFNRMVRHLVASLAGLAASPQAIDTIVRRVASLRGEIVTAPDNGQRNGKLRNVALAPTRQSA